MAHQCDPGAVQCFAVLPCSSASRLRAPLWEPGIPDVNLPGMRLLACRSQSSTASSPAQDAAAAVLAGWHDSPHNTNAQPAVCLSMNSMQVDPRLPRMVRSWPHRAVTSLSWSYRTVSLATVSHAIFAASDATARSSDLGAVCTLGVSVPFGHGPRRPCSVFLGQYRWPRQVQNR